MTDNDGIDEVMVCSDCDQPIGDLETFSLYECPDCGDTFSQEDTGSHRSECCGKFSSKVGETHEGCTASNEDAEAQFSVDGELFETREEALAYIKEEEADESDDDSEYDDLIAYKCPVCGKVYVAEGGAEDGAMLCHNAPGAPPLVETPELTDGQLDAILSKDGPGWVVIEAADYKPHVTKEAQ